MSRKVSIVDYGLGNILSVCRAISQAGFDFTLVTNPDDICSSDYLLLPGVGSFRRGMSELKSRDLVDPINEHVQLGRPLLGICLGMQLLFDSSEESASEVGFGFIPGRVVRIVPENLSVKVPHIGWSRLNGNWACSDEASQKIIEKVDDQFVYFVHSYHPQVVSKYVLASTNYQGHSINALVKNNNILGCQFHPEKSGRFGGEILKKFLAL